MQKRHSKDKPTARAKSSEATTSSSDSEPEAATAGHRQPESVPREDASQQGRQSGPVSGVEPRQDEGRERGSRVDRRHAADYFEPDSRDRTENRRGVERQRGGNDRRGGDDRRRLQGNPANDGRESERSGQRDGQRHRHEESADERLHGHKRRHGDRSPERRR